MNYDPQLAQLGQLKTTTFAEACISARLTLRQRLVEHKAAVETSLANVNQALDFIDKNPGFEEFHNIIGKVGY